MRASAGIAVPFSLGAGAAFYLAPVAGWEATFLTRVAMTIATTLMATPLFKRIYRHAPRPA